MADVQFNEEQEFSRAAAGQSSTFAQFILKTGIVKTERGANYLLIGVALLCIVFTLYMFFPEKTTPSPQTFIDGQSVFLPAPAAPSR